MLCQEILKELICIKKPEDHKVIDVWLLLLIYMNGECMKKRVEKIVKKKILDNNIPKNLIDQCISGNKDFVQVLSLIWNWEQFHLVTLLNHYYLALYRYF